MSAWIVQKEHIDVLIKSALTFVKGEDELGDLNKLGRMLWHENAASVGYRYSHHDDPLMGFKLWEADAYEYTDPGFSPTPKEASCTAHCYNYQTCEHPSWEISDAFDFTLALLDKLERKGQEIEYEGPWGWDAESVKARRNGAPALVRS